MPTRLALAVTLKLVPHRHSCAASAGMLSSDGRCRTLDARANGFARSKGERAHTGGIGGWRRRSLATSLCLGGCSASGRSVGELDGAQRLGAAHAPHAGNGAVEHSEG